MDTSLEDAITNALEGDYTEVSFAISAKRMDGDWQARITWKAGQNHGFAKETHKESAWEGFSTEQEAFKDFITNFPNAAK